MDAGTWTRITEAFARLCEAPAEERAKLLAELGPVVREEVASLLAANQSAGEFLEPVRERAAFTERQLGPYRVLGEIGRGGMGVVYLGERNDGEFRRRVAIKIAGGRLFGPEAERRFIHERQILAQLDHPGIVRLLDGGIAEGRRYLVMEYVEGESITAVARSLPLRSRLELFLQACRAVHYAHQRLIIHRDLKPANVLVTKESVVKLLDFGVAQILEGELVAEGYQTALHPLTLACASPEQLRGERLTLATDIYSLGVLLYELITGRNPQYEPGASHAVTVQRVMETEPLSPAKLDPPAPADLSAVTLKALSKQPKDRYASAAELLADVERFLQGRPVLAVPPRPAYIMARFASRNKAITATTGALIISLLAGAIFYLRQSRVESDLYRHAHRMVRTLIFDVHPKLEGTAGTIPLRRTLIAGTIQYLEGLSQHDGRNAELLQELSRSYLQMARLQGNSWNPNMGDLSSAFDHARQAEELLMNAMRAAPGEHKLLGDAALLYGELAELDLLAVRREAAAAHSKKALDYAELYAARSPGDWEARRTLARATYHHGNSIALSSPGPAIELLGRAVERFRQLSTERPSDEPMLINIMLAEWRIAEAALSHAEHATGLTHAKKGLEAAQQVFAKDPQYPRYQLYLSSGALLLSYAYTKTGDFAAATPLIERSIALRARLLTQDPNNVQNKERLADAYRALAQARVKLRLFSEVYEPATKSIALYTELQRGRKLAPLFVDGFVDALLSLGAAGEQLEKRQDACDAGRRALDLLQAQKGSENDVVMARARRFDALCRL